MTIDVGDPDWVMVGAPLADGSGVALIASREMTQVELTKHARYEFDSFRLDPAKVMNKVQVFYLRCQMKSVRIVKGVDYLDALRRLMETADWWQPAELVRGFEVGPPILNEPWIIEGEMAPKAIEG